MAQKIWMITGASRGFGAEIAKAALHAGDQVVATARKVDALDHLGNSEDLFKVAMDVTNEAQVKAAVDASLAHFRRIDAWSTTPDLDCSEQSKKAAPRKSRISIAPTFSACST